MKTRTKTIVMLCSGMFLGAVLVGVPIHLRGLMREQHYHEIERFFEGNVGKHKIIGISFFEYTGLRFMELNKWKVVMQEERGGAPVILYEEAACFQESIPHQPTIQIIDNVIFIDDGMRIFRISVEELKKPDKDNPAFSELEHGKGGAAARGFENDSGASCAFGTPIAKLSGLPAVGFTSLS